ncbi:MAG TPA: amidohydrolase family protein [Bacteroidia bacterium]|nr:amidohydrolase family protein [Bacteroidia bacterium]
MFFKILKFNCFAVIFLFFFSCKSKKIAGAVYFNGIVYTADSSFTIAEAFAVNNGKIIDAGTNEKMQAYDAKEKIDLNGKPVYPGFIDPHCHFYGYSTDLVKCDLYGTTSFAEVLDKVKSYSKTNKFSWILGRGWDQNDWEVQEFPDKIILDSLFPNTPVFLMRVDGHAILVNQKTLDIAGITAKTKIAGGEVEVKNGMLTGILIDNAKDSVKKLIPEFTEELKAEALLIGQKNCFQVGLTTVTDAGLEHEKVSLIDSLQKAAQLKMRVNAMITYDDENKKYFLEKGKIKTDRLNVCAFKIYADGALGSRGACLLQPYADKPGHYGFLLHAIDSFKMAAKEIYDHGFQMCTHAIGDSANRLMLNIYGELLKEKNDRRWRIEHCQIVNEKDFDLFGKYSIIPSVQPTHATSDMYWIDERLGKERMKECYTYRQLMEQNGMIVNGSDFPVESINPLFGFYAAVARKDQKNFPENGFQMENALTREQALRAMTIWAAYSNFEEKEKGSIEKGKFADFVILEDDIMKTAPEKIFSVKVKATYVNGEKVF